MKKHSPWAWIPSLYFAQGLPYVMVMTVSVIMYKRLDVSNTDIALYTSWLYLPWVIKPLWSPLVDLLKTKRWWIVTMQLMTGAGLAGVAFTIPTDSFFQFTLAFFWLLAFSSATHDIAADGFYMMGLKAHEQALFVGIRSTFYRIAMIFGQGILIILAGYLETTSGIKGAWRLTFLVISAAFVLFSLFHRYILPRPADDKPGNTDTIAELARQTGLTFISFFQKKNIGVALAFLLLFRLGEAQLVKLASPFMLDAVEAGGLALETSTVGLIYGTIGVIALTLGGILGGIVISIKGLKFWLLPMTLAINLPNLAYVYLSHAMPESMWLISASVALEQFGYGFGFTAYVLYMIYFSEGPNKTSHYAICTGLMALGMMLPGMVSGWIQEQIGYASFFIWVMICTIPGFLVIRFLRVNPTFGIKNTQ
ncbi:MFS transporter [Alkaliflexus imshenetskii]|uniref:MFS transporter n=1 Tax=Alkaliflexus imshenetskii TaxID=286730 RepID=UPI00047DB094|nr:MFS transporter [Alkaliflexus imshenetskii]